MLRNWVKCDAAHPRVDQFRCARIRRKRPDLHEEESLTIEKLTGVANIIIVRTAPSANSA